MKTTTTSQFMGNEAQLPARLSKRKNSGATCIIIIIIIIIIIDLISIRRNKL